MTHLDVTRKVRSKDTQVCVLISTLQKPFGQVERVISFVDAAGHLLPRRVFQTYSFGRSEVRPTVLPDDV